MAEKLKGFFAGITIKIWGICRVHIHERTTGALFTGPALVGTRLPLGLRRNVISHLSVCMRFFLLILCYWLLLLLLLSIFTIVLLLLLLLPILIGLKHLWVISSNLRFPIKFVRRHPSVRYIFEDIWLFTLLSKLAYRPLISLSM